MKTSNRASLILGLAAAVLLQPASRAKDLAELKVLYVGSERTADYEAFLRPRVALLGTHERKTFNPAVAAPYDVVILDWPQGSGVVIPPKEAPLGDRGAWKKPTVLLGSAGMILAVAWELKGASGCTCLDPAAYGLREHEIFERPRKIERKMMRVGNVEVLPLVDGYQRGGSWRPGFCSYSDDFANNPEVEIFCGGVNLKTPTAAALWRQGNLLHFGFEQSPAEMNGQGRQLLLNCIAYISRFNEDQCIAVTPSVMAVPGARPRSAVIRYVRGNHDDWAGEILAPELWARLSRLKHDELAAWAAANARFLHLGGIREIVDFPRPVRRIANAPQQSRRLEIDEDLAALGVPFDAPDFFDKAIAALRSGGPSEAARAARVLERYAPCGPQGGAEAWARWWKENKIYAFASDAGDYRWYLDPLAKKRGIPRAELRGPKRADLPPSAVVR